MFHLSFPILLHPLTAGACPAFMLILSYCVTKNELQCAVTFQSRSYHIQRFVFILVADVWTDSCSTSLAQYPLTVGVVVAETSGLERGCGLLAHGCSKA